MAELAEDPNTVRHIERAFMEKTSLKLKKKKGDAQQVEQEATEPTQELLNVAQDAQEELMRVNTIFPLNLFPDTIAIDRQKVSIIKRSFFRTAKIVSVKITDVLNVESNVGPFVGSIRIYSKYFVDNFHEINAMSRQDATDLHDILQGYMIATEKEIDCSQIPRDELILMLKELGHPTDS
jgi:hypothetical protein